jgi:hypothetical protein
VCDLGDLPEVDVLCQGDEGEIAEAAGVDQCVRRAVTAAYELVDRGRGPDADEFVDVPADAGRVPRQGHSGGEAEFACVDGSDRVMAVTTGTETVGLPVVLPVRVLVHSA